MPPDPILGTISLEHLKDGEEPSHITRTICLLGTPPRSEHCGVDNLTCLGAKQVQVLWMPVRTSRQSRVATCSAVSGPPGRYQLYAQPHTPWTLRRAMVTSSNAK
jgi:hypothetical protein